MCFEFGVLFSFKCYRFQFGALFFSNMCCNFLILIFFVGLWVQLPCLFSICVVTCRFSFFKIFVGLQLQLPNQSKIWTTTSPNVPCLMPWALYIHSISYSPTMIIVLPRIWKYYKFNTMNQNFWGLQVQVHWLHHCLIVGGQMHSKGCLNCV